jgi:hypothetical protein
MNKKINLFLIITIFSFWVLMPVLSLAQGGNLQDPPPAPITTVQQILDLIDKVLTWFARIFWIFAIGAVFYSAFLFLTASGNPERVKKAKNQLLYAVIAMAIGILAWGAPKLIENVLGGGSTPNTPNNPPPLEDGPIIGDSLWDPGVSG